MVIDVVFGMAAAIFASSTHPPDLFGSCLQRPAAVRGEFPTIYRCYVDEYRREDQYLNNSYQAAMRRLAPPRRPALRNAQRRWIIERDRRCEAIVAQTSDTDTQDGALERVACLTEATHSRSAWIKRYN